MLTLALIAVFILSFVGFSNLYRQRITADTVLWMLFLVITLSSCTTFLFYYFT